MRSTAMYLYQQQRGIAIPQQEKLAREIRLWCTDSDRHVTIIDIPGKETNETENCRGNLKIAWTRN